jgi:hypothetical protein
MLAKWRSLICLALPATLCTALIFAPFATAVARHAFVQALEPCLESLSTSSAEDDPALARYHVVLGPSWMVSLFAVAEKDGGHLGSDICGEIGSGWDLNGPYAWPSSLGEPMQKVDLEMITPVWLDHIVRSARAEQHTTAPISRISITRLPEPNTHLVRVAFADAEAQVEAPESIDLNQNGEVIARDTRVPDQFARIDSEPPQKVQAEAVLPATRAPLDALKLLLSATKATPEAQILRLTLTNFDAPKPHWSLVAQEPFEYFDLPGQIE